MLKNSTLIMEKFRIQKISKLFTLISVGVLLLSCDLDENPPFLDDPVSLYNDVTSSEYARDGIYAAFTHYNAMEQRLFVENGYSGLLLLEEEGTNSVLYG